MTRGYTSRLAISGALRFQVRKHQVTRYCPMFFQLCDLWFHDHLPVWTLMTNSKIDWYIPDHACVFLSLYCTTIFAKLHSCPIPIPVGSVCICCWLYIYLRAAAPAADPGRIGKEAKQIGIKTLRCFAPWGFRPFSYVYCCEIYWIGLNFHL